MTMKLKQLHIENFRSLRNVTWEPGDLNVLIGPNAGGKSNLLKAIDLLAAAANGELRDHITKQGGMRLIAWNGTPEPIIFDAQVLQDDVESKTQERCSFEYRLAFQKEDKSNEYSVIDEYLGQTRESGGFTQRMIHRTADEGSIDGDEDSLSFSSGELKKAESVFAFVKAPRVGGPLLRQFGRYMGGWFAYQFFRSDPDAPVRWSEISRREPSLRSNGANLVSVLHTLYSDNSAFESDVNDAMFAAFGDEFVKLVFSPDAADQRIQLKVRWKSLENPVPASELSDGTLRYLYLIAILANPNPPPLIAIDEPETGLHPRMMEYIAEFVPDTARRTQVVFATHSQAFLDAINRCRPTTTLVESQNSETQIKNVPSDILDRFLKNSTLGELFRSAALEAIS